MIFNEGTQFIRGAAQHFLPFWVAQEPPQLFPWQGRAELDITLYVTITPTLPCLPVMILNPPLGGSPLATQPVAPR